MAFGSFCGNCCAWFSVIGVFTFGTLAMMLYRRNPPVVEHKFHLKEGQDTKIDERMQLMITMQFIMIVAALSCFGCAFVLEKKEAR